MTFLNKCVCFFQMRAPLGAHCLSDVSILHLKYLTQDDLSALLAHLTIVLVVCLITIHSSHLLLAWARKRESPVIRKRPPPPTPAADTHVWGNPFTLVTPGCPDTRVPAATGQAKEPSTQGFLQAPETTERETPVLPRVAPQVS